MTTVWVVYSQFPNDPSTIGGIFTTKDKAKEYYNNWEDNYKDMIEIELDEQQAEDRIVRIDNGK